MGTKTHGYEDEEVSAEVLQSPEGSCATSPPLVSVTAAAREVISADEVATFLGVNRKTVYDAANRGQLPSRRLGRRLLFSRSAVLAWLQCKGSSERPR
jgi:excisionase family DNA binding protein